MYISYSMHTRRTLNVIHIHTAGVMDRLYFVLILVFTPKLLGHPQCLDGKPPFESSPRLQFCTEYSDVGCCTSLEDRRINER